MRMEILTSVITKTALPRSYALSWKPCQGDSLNLPDHRIHKDRDRDASFQLKSDSLSHAYAQNTKTFYKHQDSRIMKAQELKTKTSAQTLIYKIFLQRYQVYQGRLLASFQDDAKYEHVGQDTRSQGGKDDQDKQGKYLKISKFRHGLFMYNDDDQEIFHDAIEYASENFNENHIVSQTDHDQSEVDHNGSKEKDHLVDKLIKKYNQKIAKCQKHKMADENVPAPAPTRFDDQILPFAAWVPIGKSNHVLDLQKCWKHKKCRSLPSYNRS
ncbi:hypothetical protein Tco_1276068 [Tanacetum coccineum]